MFVTKYGKIIKTEPESIDIKLQAFFQYVKYQSHIELNKSQTSKTFVSNIL